VRSDSIENDAFSPAGAGGAGIGLGNLADELADAWDDDEEEEEVDMNFQEGEGGKVEQTRDSGVDVQEERKESLAPPANGHRRKGSDYDGSDYGEDSEVETLGSLPPSLVARMDQVENLAKRGIDNFGSEGDGVVKRVVESLKDLGSQANVEGGATRYASSLSA
jgi:phage I-like protein